MIDQAVIELTPLVGVRAGCAAVGEAQARWYRRHRQSSPPERTERVLPSNASAYDQDEMAWALYQWQGKGPWGGRC